MMQVVLDNTRMVPGLERRTSTRFGTDALPRKAVETVRSRQTELKERAAAAKTAAECVALQSAWARAVAKLRARQDRDL